MDYDPFLVFSAFHKLGRGVPQKTKVLFLNGAAIKDHIGSFSKYLNLYNIHIWWVRPEMGRLGFKDLGNTAT